MTRLKLNLEIEWRWQNSNPLSCTRDAHGHLSCVADQVLGGAFPGEGKAAPPAFLLT
ncbi:MAG TPA: hypothetical protein VLX28_10745 [Thermoanaerobaculia bacterium]|nr:hypothetical protein [Thermoanaerobaculia bacterium]